MSGGANTALLVVVDSTSLTSAETAISGRLAAAGLTVTNIDDGASAPADVNTYSLVVVCPSANTGTTYRDITAPLLWINSLGLYDNYLVASNTASVTTAENQDDVLTVHQSTGSLAVANYQTCSLSPGSGGAKQYYSPATMVGGAVARMHTALHSEPVAWTIESCGDLSVGTAPNRRAVLQWIDPTWNFPTANTTTIADGFIAWCLAGTPCPRGGLKVRGFLVRS